MCFWGRRARRARPDLLKRRPTRPDAPPAKPEGVWNAYGDHRGPPRPSPKMTWILFNFAEAPWLKTPVLRFRAVHRASWSETRWILPAGFVFTPGLDCLWLLARGRHWEVDELARVGASLAFSWMGDASVKLPEQWFSSMGPLVSNAIWPADAEVFENQFAPCLFVKDCIPTRKIPPVWVP